MIKITTGLDHTAEKRRWLMDNVGALKPGSDSLLVHEGEGWYTAIRWGSLTEPGISVLEVKFDRESDATAFLLRWS